ncbi:MAG: transcription-repair coupling factor [bacterium]
MNKLQDLLALAGQGPAPSFSGLSGSALAFALARLFRQGQGPLLLFVPDEKRAAELEEDLAFFLGSAEPLLMLPPLGILPYYGLSPNPDVTARRLATLHALLQRREPYLAIFSTSALLRRLPPKGIFGTYSDYVVAGEELPRDDFQRKLLAAGYLSVPIVEDPGTFCKRGGILDVFSPQLERPVRLEFFGDQVESLRYFDPESQRSQEALEEFVVIPAREVLFSEEGLALAAKRFRERADELGLPKSEREPFTDALRHRMAPPALETYLPLFYEQGATLFDYLPAQARAVWVEPELGLAQLEELRGEGEAAHAASHGTERLVRPEELFLSREEVAQALAARRAWPCRELQSGPESLGFSVGTHEELSALLKHAHLSEEMLKPLTDRLREWLRASIRVLLVAGTHSQRLRLQDLLERAGLPLRDLPGGFAEFVDLKAQAQNVYLCEGHLSKGFLWEEEGLALLSDQEVFGEKQRRRKAEARKAEAFTTFEELAEGDYIVHEQHGLGIYRGLQHLNLDGQPNDFLLLEYLGGDKLYLPVYRLNLVSRYTAQEGHVPRLDKLGAGTWDKNKAKVRKALRAMAGELLKLYAERATLRGHAFSPGGVLYEEFEATFPFEETPDQLRAIRDVNQDMDDERPMDRLICGDVGFGKTEVAMRAAFRAILDNKQVAVLVPTTVLALQHERNFRARFQNFPAKIEMLSRFVRPKQHQEVLEGLKSGKVDIVVGTHSLLGKEVQFKDLGLMIVDEEHRFGVAQKEKIKKFKKLADVLTLTATPIPRTLNMSLSGIRDLSVIATPPVDRLAIQTFVAPYNEDLIREAILRELSRGGQVYFIHNRVQNILEMKKRLEEIVPEAKIEIGHGQMEEGKLEEVMIRFVNREFNVFLSTTIVESGLDIPSANTMVVNRADTFGLAQLYQLRGRIGRSNLRAYAYLMIPGQEAITTQARARLAVLQRYTDLGSGFKIAAHDLEIRGAGNLLGPEQSGHIAAVGYDLYTRMLEEAMLEVKGEERREAPDPELQLKLAAAIPEDYIPETTMRLTLYKRLAGVVDEAELDALAEEIHDRFGKLPESVQNLLVLMRVKALARRAWIKQVRLEARRAVFVFDEGSPVDVAELTRGIAREPERFRWLAPQELAMNFKAGKEAAAVDSIQKFLAGLKIGG